MKMIAPPMRKHAAAARRLPATRWAVNCGRTRTANTITAVMRTKPMLFAQRSSPSAIAMIRADLGEHQPPDDEDPPGDPDPTSQRDTEDEQQGGVHQARHDRDGHEGDHVVLAGEVPVPGGDDGDDEHECGEGIGDGGEAVRPAVVERLVGHMANGGHTRPASAS